MDSEVRTAIQSQVRALQWHEEVTSTSALVLQAARDGEPAGLLVAADRQTAGRGRLDRTWHAPPGTSVLCSLLLRPALPRSIWPRFSLAAGLALDEVASRHVPRDRVGLKWPNDVQIDGVKVAGILLESSGDAVVIGVGINVDWRGADRPSGLLATSLAEARGSDVDRDGVLVEVAAALVRWSDRLESDPDGVVPAYAPRCTTLGTAVSALGVTGHPDAVVGTAVGLTLDGHLRIRQADGVEVAVSGGDVTHLR